MKWKLASMAAIFCAFAVIATALLWIPKEDRVNEVSFDQIELGKSLAEVRETLGDAGESDCAKCDERLSHPGRELTHTIFINWPGEGEPVRRLCWQGEDAIIMVRIGQGDIVEGRKIAVFKKQQGLLDRIRERLGW